MKKIILLGIFIASSLFAGDLKWNSYREGMLNAENKPILYQLSATYCAYCKKNKKLMNEDKTLNKYLSENFILVSQEKDVEIIPTYLDASITPTYYILNSHGVILGKQLRGYQDKDTLLKFLNLGLYKYKNQ